MKTLIRQSIFAGLLIGLGSVGFLALGGLPGAVIFAFGLIGVVLTNTTLYTGQAGVTTNIGNLTIIWIFNILACFTIGLLVLKLGGEPVERAREIATDRIGQSPVDVFIRAIGCGLIIDIACFAYSGTEIVGCGGVCVYDEMPSPDNLGGKCAYLMNIYTRQEYRHHGIATRVVEHLIAEAKARSIDKIYLETSADGERMYRKLGFKDMKGYMKL